MKKWNVIFSAVMAACLMFAVISCDSREQLYIYNWTYYTPDSVIEKFEDEYNVRVIYDEFASNEDMYTKLYATKNMKTGYDIVFPSNYYVTMMINQDMLAKLDKSKIPNLRNIDRDVLAKATYDPDMNYAVPYFYGAAGIAVNTAKVPNFEKSWSIFSRQDLKNRMTMLDDIRDVMGAALITMGHSVNTTDASAITAARDLINTAWKPNLVKFDSEAFGKGYANGDFWVVHAYPEVVFEEIEGDRLLIRDTVFFIPSEGAPSYIDNMVILKNARNIDLAHKFIDFIHRPEIYAEFADIFGLPATVNVPARDYKTGHAWYSAEDLLNTELIEDVGEHLEIYDNAWVNSIRAGN